MIRLYHTADLHDRRGFAPQLQALRARQPGLLFDCGDALRGSQTLYRRREPVLRELDEAGYDAQCLGNREFHYLFACLRARAARMRHPLVCTNLRDLKGRPLPFAAALRFAGGDGTVVHVLGLLVMQYRCGSPWERLLGWGFLNPQEAVEPYARALAPGEALVVLSHLGLSLDRRLAAAVPRIDLILGGHSHDTLAQPEYAGEVPIVHAGPYARFVSQTELVYDPQRRRFAVAGFALLPLRGAA